VQLIAGFVNRKQVKSVGENLPSLKESEWTDDDGPLAFSIQNATTADGYIRLALPHLDAFAIKIWTPLTAHNGLPILCLVCCALSKQLNKVAHRSVSHLRSASSKYSGARSIPTDLLPSWLATSMAVPVPQKGSSTKPDGGHVASMGILQRSSG